MTTISSSTDWDVVLSVDPRREQRHGAERVCTRMAAANIATPEITLLTECPDLHSTTQSLILFEIYIKYFSKKPAMPRQLHPHPYFLQADHKPSLLILYPFNILCIVVILATPLARRADSHADHVPANDGAGSIRIPASANRHLLKPTSARVPVAGRLRTLERASDGTRGDRRNRDCRRPPIPRTHLCRTLFGRGIDVAEDRCC